MLDASQLYRPTFWGDPSAVHDLFAQMRTEAPVHHCQADGYPDLWHITKHKDIFEVERRTDVFLNEPRGNIASLEVEGQLRKLGNGTLAPIRTLVNMDNPEHQKMRLLTQSWFMPKNLAKLRGGINDSIDLAFAALREANGQCDFAKDIAVEFPLRVIMQVLGVPPSDFPMMLRLTQEIFGPEDPDTKRDTNDEGGNAADSMMAVLQEFGEYFYALAEQRRRAPKDDISSILATAEVDGKPIDPVALLGYFIIISTAGHDTTSYSLTEAVRQLALSPDLLRRLKEDPDAVAPKIVEEAIRVAAPVRHFVRTARQDFQLNGQTINAGDAVILWYASGSRDEDVFERPDEFDIDRDMSTRHASFGHGAHLCLGMHLARQENIAFLKRLGREISAIKVVGASQYTQAHFVSGIKSMPVEISLA